MNEDKQRAAEERAPDRQRPFRTGRRNARNIGCMFHPEDGRRVVNALNGRFVRDDDFDSRSRIYVGYNDNSALITRDGAVLVGRLEDWKRPDAPTVAGIAALPPGFTMSPAAALFPNQAAGDNE